MDGWIDICYALGREEIRVNQSGISSEHTFISELKIVLTRFVHEVLAISTVVLFPPIDKWAFSKNVKYRFRFLSQQLPFSIYNVSVHSSKGPNLAGVGVAAGKGPACQPRRLKDTCLEALLEEGMATASSIPAWRIPWKEKPGGLWSTVSQRVRHNWSSLAHTHTVNWYSKTNKAGYGAG